MLSAIVGAGLHAGIEQLFVAQKNALHEAKYERTVSKNDADYVGKMMLLGSSVSFMSDLLKWHKNMNLTTEQIDHIVDGLEDLIEEFSVFKDFKGSDEYAVRASEFYRLIVKTQIELGFYRVERNAA